MTGPRVDPITYRSENNKVLGGARSDRWTGFHFGCLLLLADDDSAVLRPGLCGRGRIYRFYRCPRDRFDKLTGHCSSTTPGKSPPN